MKNGRIAVPSEGKGGIDAARSIHFGHCSVFTLVDIIDGSISNVSTVPNQEHRDGGCMVPVAVLTGCHVDAIIVGGMGMRPLDGFNQAGIDVYFNQTCPDVQSVITEFLAGNLTIMTADKVCGSGHHH